MVKKTTKKICGSFPLWVKVLLGVVAVLVLAALIVIGGMKKQSVNFISDIFGKTMNKEIFVTTGSEVTVDYIGSLEDKTIFDTSIKEVAQDAGIFNAERDYTEKLTFTVGSGKVIPGFEEGVLGMKLGETKTITITPEKGYGPETLEVPATLEEIEPLFGTGNVKVGAKQEFQGKTIEVAEVNENNVLVKIPNPFPLAGKTLIFEITVHTIK